MIDFIQNNRSKYHEIIIDALVDYSYRMKRYDLNYSVAVGYSEPGANLAEFIKMKRQTDTFIVLEDNLCCIIFDGANSDSAIKAASNMQTSFQHKYFNIKLFVSIVTGQDYYNDTVMVHSLFDVLEYSLLNNMDNIVMDSHQLLKHNK